MQPFRSLQPASCNYSILRREGPPARDRRAVYLLLGVNVFAYAVHLAVADNLVRYGVLSWALLLFFIAWTAPAAWRTLGGSR